MLDIVLGFAYAFAFGYSSRLPLAVILIDAALCTLMLYVVAFTLWSVYTFSRLEVLDNAQSLLVNIVYCVIGIIFFAGIETVVVYIFNPESTDVFLSDIVSRVFCQIIIFCAYRWYYLYNRGDSGDDELSVDKEEVSDTEDTPEIIERITVRVGQKIKIIQVEDIIYLKAEDDYVSVVTMDGHWLKSETMKGYEAILPHNMFVRVHRSYIVNITKITKIERYGQKQQLVLHGGTEVRISATGYKTLKEKLNL